MQKQDQDFDIFLSYSHVDAVKVGRLIQRLKSDGFTLWIDEEQIGGGDPLRRVMVEGIKKSAHVFVCLSTSYLESKWPTFETAVSQAMDPDNRKRRLVPIRIEPCNTPEEYAWLYCPNLADEPDWEKEYAKAVKNVKETKVHVEVSSKQPPPVVAPELQEIHSLLTELNGKRQDVKRELISGAYEFLRGLCIKAEPRENL